MTLLTEFGSPLEASIETDRRGYVGKPFDPLTGLYNYGYRDYRPELGRFTTVDPIRDGMNWYVYTGNDPVNYVDFWGLATEDAITAAIDELGANEYGQSSTGAIVVDILKILNEDGKITQEDIASRAAYYPNSGKIKIDV